MVPEDPSADVLVRAAETFGLLASSAARSRRSRPAPAPTRCAAGLADRGQRAPDPLGEHLTKLKLAGLVRSRREGRRQVYFVDDPDVVDVVRLAVGRLTERAADEITHRAGDDVTGRAAGGGSGAGPAAPGPGAPAARLRGL